MLFCQSDNVDLFNDKYPQKQLISEQGIQKGPFILKFLVSGCYIYRMQREPLSFIR